MLDLGAGRCMSTCTPSSIARWSASCGAARLPEIPAAVLTSYATGRSVAFYDGVDSIADWARVQRVGCRTEMTVDHLMANAAIPLLFPPMKIGEE